MADNLRSMIFLKDHCLEEQLEAVLISLDAKKAFDSVDHEYIVKSLEKYGFGPIFIGYFRTLYTNITARILINGYLSDPLSILRGVKQGDALSCALFIICIDPLLRNLNADMNIESIPLLTEITKEEIKHKAGAFADDVSVICRGDRRSVQNVFNQYERLTVRSGVELNADKTEILSLHTHLNKIYNIQYDGKTFPISTLN